MATFDDVSIKDDWKTYQLFRYGPVSLFYKSEVLQEAIEHLSERAYILPEFDCRDCESEAALFNAILLRLEIIKQEYVGIRGIQFWDLLGEIKVPDESGVVLVLRHFDVFHRAFSSAAQGLLESVADYHYRKIWFGLRFKAFVQTDDPTLEIGFLKALTARWNDKEQFKKNRMP